MAQTVGLGPRTAVCRLGLRPVLVTPPMKRQCVTKDQKRRCRRPPCQAAWLVSGPLPAPPLPPAVPLSATYLFAASTAYTAAVALLVS